MNIFSIVTNRFFLAVAGVSLMFAGCASSNTWFTRTRSRLPIEVFHSGNGQIMSYTAYEASNKLYVTGTAQNRPLSVGGHVDIQLFDARGRVIAEKHDDINPPYLRPGYRQYSDSYVASFPLSQAREAARIRVAYHTVSRH